MASTTSSQSVDDVAESAVDALVAEYDDALRRRARAAAAGRPSRVPALRRAYRARAAAVPGGGGFNAFTTQLRGPRRASAAARASRPTADGRRLRLRRRGRLEDLGAGTHPQGDGRRRAWRYVLHGGLHVPPRSGRAERPRRAHARGLPVASPTARPSLEIHPLGIGGREDPVRLVFRSTSRRTAFVVGLRRPRRPVPLGRQRHRGRPAGRAAAAASRGLRGLEAGARSARLRRRRG